MLAECRQEFVRISPGGHDSAGFIVMMVVRHNIGINAKLIAQHSAKHSAL
jgi:hypothetical protein